MGQFNGGGRSQNGALVAQPDQTRQITGMIKVGMGEQHGIQAGRLNRKRRPVAFSEVFQALKQAAIDQQFLVAVLQQCAGAGNRTCRPKKTQFESVVLAHVAPLSLSCCYG